MTRKARVCQPQATPLESKILLSLTTTPEAAKVPSERSGTMPAEAITNAIKGVYFAGADNRAADAPLHVLLDGTGRVNGIGRAELSGSLDLGGFRISGQDDVTGTLTLSNAKGNVKLQLSGSGGFAEVPNGRFVTTVMAVKGTGPYRGYQRNGTVTVQFGENQARSVKAPSTIGGTMTVTLSLKPLVK